jgi:Mn-containing catalase
LCFDSLFVETSTEEIAHTEMLAFLIARGTMHQNHWLAVIEDLGRLNNFHPIPFSFPHSKENSGFAYVYQY